VIRQASLKVDIRRQKCEREKSYSPAGSAPKRLWQII
jgi:hypothetical protein